MEKVECHESGCGVTGKNRSDLLYWKTDMKKALVLLLFVAMCTSDLAARGKPESASGLLDTGRGQEAGEIEFEESRGKTQARLDMVRDQIEGRNIEDRRTLEAMRSVPRHLFMPEDVAYQAYEDHPVPIGDGQTISQPYIVALMTESLQLDENHRVLEIGTGSGYQAAVLSMIAGEVYTIEIRKLLHDRSSGVLEELNFANVKTRHADGYYGWEQYAPFDAIMITAAVDHIPRPLLDQLVDGGRLILPIGDPFGFQDLVLVEKHGEDYRQRYVTGVIFVPMTGKALE